MSGPLCRLSTKKNHQLLDLHSFLRISFYEIPVGAYISGSLTSKHFKYTPFILTISWQNRISKSDYSHRQHIVKVAYTFDTLELINARLLQY